MSFLLLYSQSSSQSLEYLPESDFSAKFHVRIKNEFSSLRNAEKNLKIDKQKVLHLENKLK